MARIHSGTATTTPAELAIGMTFCAAITVQNTGSGTLQVNVPALHANEYDSIAAGEERVYRAFVHIKMVTVKSPTTTTYQVSPIMGEA